MAVPAFMFVSAFRALLPIALGFAAGCMVWMVFAELLPDALQGCSHAKVPPTPPPMCVLTLWLVQLSLQCASDLPRPWCFLASLPQSHCLLWLLAI